MMHIKTLLLSAGLLALGTSTFAQQSCFARFYEAEHMRKNPNQVVDALSIRFEGPATDKTTTGEWGDVTAYFIGSTSKFTSTLYCQMIDGKRWCGVECDGGGAVITWKNRDTILLKTEGFVVSGGCDEAEAEMRFVKDKTDGFTTFRLNRAPMEACPPLDQ